MRKHNLRSRTGMSLIELMIVIGIMGILFAAVYMFFVKGTEQFHFTRRQNQLATTGRIALEVLSDEIIWAGYMPTGGWTDDEWHPVETATSGTFDFYADRDGNKALTNDEYRNIYLDATSNIVYVTDDLSNSRVVGTEIVAMEFDYLDAGGTVLSKPLVEADRDAVRHVSIKLTLQDTYLGDVYQTVMQTTVTPRNLGVLHNFDPLFYMPPPPEAKIVVNVDGDTLSGHTPTAHQWALLNKLDNWGFTIVELSDDQLESYDYDTSGVDLVILRVMAAGASHIAIAPTLQAIPVPIIALDANDAVDVFSMGTIPGTHANSAGRMFKSFLDHPIHDYVNPDSTGFYMYEVLTPGAISTLDGYNVGTELITAFMPDSISGVSVVHEDTLSLRRIHYCAPDFASYSLHGYGFLYNVVTWTLPAPSEPELGEEINIEGFETDLLGEIPIVFWEDDLEGGVLLPDSVPLYTDFGSASKSMVWMHTSSGAGEINNLTDLSLEMHRTVTGAFDRNIAGTTVDLSAYSTLSDELYLTVQTWKGNVEWIDAKDGVFLNRLPIALAAENFEAAPYDVTFWEDTGGRHRIHSPSWGGNSTKFVTLDNQPGTMTYQRSRMLIELDTSTLPDGTPIVVNYRMADHQDATDNFSSIDNSGDYIGWSFGSGISDTVEGYEDLNPSLYADGVWYDRTYTFTPSGSMPSALYIICSHYGNDIAVTAFEYDGISFDDITVSAADFERVGTPVDAAGWQNIAVDLDDAAQNYGIPFSSGFGIALSQYGQGPWSSNYGMHWRYFELGVIKQTFSIPGWHHAPVVAGENDDWLLENVAGDYKWTLHANNPSYYSNLTNCYLETPEITIPTGAVDAQLSFEHSVNFETGYDYGWIEISTDGGTTWNVFETSSYNDTYGGHGAYTGFISNSTVDLDLVSHIGLTVQLRFVFKSDDLIVAAGWTLDDFVASGSYSGVVINSIGFKPTMVGGGWFFNDVDVYLGSTTEEFFPGDGEWDKTNLTFLGTYGVGATMDEWVIINLIDDYSLLASANLIVKIEMAQTGPAPGFEWVTALHPGMARREVSSSADPTMLLAVDQRPAFMIGTDDYGQRFVDGDSTGSTDLLPMAFNYEFSDFEGIYTMADLGFGENAPWVPGGLNNDWEIGVPLFTPDIDPGLIPKNENKIAGTDLTDDGNYTPNAEWNWIRSGAYELSEVVSYDSIAVAYDRCLRLSFADEAFIQMAFTDGIEPPTENIDWITVESININEDLWHYDVIQLTSYFQDAIGMGKTHYFIRFVLSAGPFVEYGGWNIDNVGFYGRFAI